MTTPRNVIPQAFILSESFPNEEGIRSYFSQIGQTNFFTSLEEKNSGKDKVTPLEKTVEVTGNALNTLNSQQFKNNKEYLAQIKKIEEDTILDHSTITILFSGVSNDFVNRLQSYQLCYNITRKDFDGELLFWAPPDYLHDKETALMYLELHTKFANLKDTLKSKHNIQDPRDIKRVMPAGYGTNAVVTTGVRKWQEILLKGTSFKEDHELRFVLINLAKTLRSRNHNLFVNMYLESRDGKRFGVDTLKSSDDAWNNYRIIFS